MRFVSFLVRGFSFILSIHATRARLVVGVGGGVVVDIPGARRTKFASMISIAREPSGSSSLMYDVDVDDM